MSRVQFWVVKASLKTEWKFHWKEYFSRDDDPLQWGVECIRSTGSKQLLRDEVAKDDIAVCYQVDDKTIWALAQFESVEKQIGREDFALYHRSKSLRLNPPLGIDDLRNNNWDPECFRPGGYGHGTIAPIDCGEFVGIIETLQKTSSSAQWKKIRNWLLRAGIERFGPRGYVALLLEDET